MSRLIDADALIAEMHNVILEDGEDRRTFYEVIERQPTIEPQRKKGRWIKARYVLTSDPVQYVWNCSECGKSVNGRSAVVLTDYCPDCGSYNGG